MFLLPVGTFIFFHKNSGACTNQTSLFFHSVLDDFRIHSGDDFLGSLADALFHCRDLGLGVQQVGVGIYGDHVTYGWLVFQLVGLHTFAMTALNTVTDGHFASLFRWDKVKNIAAYILNVHVDDKYYFNFADCSPIAGRAGVREYLFGKATGQEDLCLFAVKDFQAGQGQLITDEVNGGNLFYRMQSAFHYEELQQQDTSATLSHRDVYYPSVGLLLVHSGTMDLAVKAGDNADSHNHNDTGSITLYKNGQPILVDIGVETYTQKTFSPRRYEIWTMQSGYHNLPTICGADQKDGEEYRAENVITELRSTEPSVSMELAAAYPAAQTTVPDLTYVRKVTLKKSSNTVVLEDRTNAEDVILNFITYEKPIVLSAGEIALGDAVAAFEGATLSVVENLPITDARLKTAWDHDLYRIRLRISGTDFKLIIK